jgi:hypothetical protein
MASAKLVRLGAWATTLNQITKKDEESKFGKVAAALSLDEGCEEIKGFNHVSHEHGEKFQLGKAGDTEGKFLQDFEQVFLPTTTEEPARSSDQDVILSLPVGPTRNKN